MKAFVRRGLVLWSGVLASVSIACFDGQRAIFEEPDLSRGSNLSGVSSAIAKSVGSISGTKSDTTITVFLLDPNVTSAYPIATVHKLWVRAGGVCVLGSTYGIGHWDDPCTIATTAILITAKSWFDSENHPHIDFFPELRFAPLGGRRASAELYMKDKAASLDSTSVILWCEVIACIDEALTDPSLETFRDKQQGFVYRRIKHFSGYEVTSGRDSTDTTTVIQ